MKKFENLLRSEIKKINKFAQRRDGKDSQITGWFASGVDELGFVEVRCEICSEDCSVREADVVFEVFMPDRRMSCVCEPLSK